MKENSASIVSYTLADCMNWDRVVKSFQDYDVYYLSGYTRPFSLHGDGEPMLLYAQSDGVRAINVVMKRDVSEVNGLSDAVEPGMYYDLVTPYGYGGWLIEGESEAGVEAIDVCYQEWCWENSIISEFVRFHPVLQNQLRALPGYEVIPLGRTIMMDLSSHEVIWQNLTSKNRNVIRKAMKLGVSIGHGSGPELYDAFKALYDSTMLKDDADLYYFFDRDFYKSLSETLSNHSEVFYAQLEDGSIIAASIMLNANGKMSYHLSGSDSRYRNMAAGNLLLYEAAKWGCDNGLETFHLGGGVGSSEEDGLFAFKKAFVRNEEAYTRFAIGKRVFLLEEYARLTFERSRFKASRGEDSSNGFFPEYRA